MRWQGEAVTRHDGIGPVRFITTSLEKLHRLALIQASIDADRPAKLDEDAQIRWKAGEHAERDR